MDSWVVIAVYGRDNTDNRGWLWLSVVSRVGKLHLTLQFQFSSLVTTAVHKTTSTVYSWGTLRSYEAIRCNVMKVQTPERSSLMT